MGSGGSKAKTVKIKEIEDTTKSDKRRKSNLSNRESELPRTPEHRKPPKGIRRPSPHRHNRGSGSAPPAENFVPYEAEDLSLTGDWELEKSIDVGDLNLALTHLETFLTQHFSNLNISVMS
ncbi:hypothetical protein DPMN_121064 [Dreissena polymorpha]|uniref:Uncharacterized protein n=1 Tax=Dreissena polymorpha TaxID=45954 RepID=A0A9D4GL10_DREPO|nr:hypothetical protein DPMN_121064 [Dreissena polymorpha]